MPVNRLLDVKDALQFKGVVDCSGNPNYPAASAGHVYVVSAAGRIGGASGPAVEINDRLLCKTDDSASGDQAAVGANWSITQGNLDAFVVPNAYAATELTIASGSITPTRSSHTVDTESDASSDDLVTIVGTAFKAGDLLTLSAASGSRDVVVKATGGNILLPNDTDITLDDAEKTLVLRFDGTNWNYVAGGGSSSTEQFDGTISSATIDIPKFVNNKKYVKITLGSGARVAQADFSIAVNTPNPGETRITLTNYASGWNGLAYAVDA